MMPNEGAAMSQHEELVRAAHAGDLATVKRLIEAGADPTIREVNSDTPSSWASGRQRGKSVIDQLCYEGSGAGPGIIAEA